MHKRYAPIVAAGAAVAIIFAAGTAAITRSHTTGQARTGPSQVTADPVGADDWMYLQRANADGSIPAAAVNEAIAQSKAAGAATKGSPHAPFGECVRRITGISVKCVRTGVVKAGEARTTRADTS